MPGKTKMERQLKREEIWKDIFKNCDLIEMKSNQNNIYNKT